MKEENKFSLRHIVVALVCAIVGILCMWCGNPLISNVGSVLLVSILFYLYAEMSGAPIDRCTGFVV